jgi:uncharacterized small protein (DUF1192 family)
MEPMLTDEDLPKKQKPFQIGQPLEEMSVAEITETIELLQAEIARLSEAAKTKSAHLSAADALFSPKK